MSITEQWVLAWSQRQNALHVETLQDHQQANLRACLRNEAGDYRVLLVGTREQVNASSASMHLALARRSNPMPRAA